MDPKKVILITGAGRGLGAAVAEYMSSQGLRIILADKNKIDLRELNSKNILSYQVDVSKRQEVKDMFASAYNRF